MDYTLDQLAELYQEVMAGAQIQLKGRSRGGLPGQSITVALATAINGKNTLSAIAWAACPPGECVVTKATDGNWYALSPHTSRLISQQVRQRKSSLLTKAIKTHTIWAQNGNSILQLRAVDNVAYVKLIARGSEEYWEPDSLAFFNGSEPGFQRISADRFYMPQNRFLSSGDPVEGGFKVFDLATNNISAVPQLVSIDNFYSTSTLLGDYYYAFVDDVADSYYIVEYDA